LPLAQALEWRASYTARKIEERRSRPNALPAGAAGQAGAAGGGSAKGEEDAMPRFQPDTVVSFSLGAPTRAARAAAHGCWLGSRMLPPLVEC
jgi:hypothetical protein